MGLDVDGSFETDGSQDAVRTTSYPTPGERRVIADIKRREADKLGKGAYESFIQALHAVVQSLTRRPDEPQAN